MSMLNRNKEVRNVGYPELYTNLFLPFSDAVFWAKIILDAPKMDDREKRKKEKKKAVLRT